MASGAAGHPDFHATRRDELQTLEGALMRGTNRIVVVTGAPGAGKTSTVMAFANAHAAAFPGGVRVLSPIDPIVGKLPRLAGLDIDKPALVVLDEADRMPVPWLQDLNRYLAAERPRARILMTSGVPLFLDDATIAVELPPLSVPMVLQLLSRQSGASEGRLGRVADLLEGNAAAVEAASRRLAGGMPADRLIEWLEGGALAVARGPEGQPLVPGSPQRRALDIAVAEVSDELIRELAEHPALMYKLDPRKFEELVTELYRRRGYEATLTPASGDEGADVYVVSRDDLGRSLWVVQAKRYAAHNKIGAGVVRELYGTVMAKNASAGVLVTTSFFEPGAKRMEREFEYRLSLKDYLGLQEMLRLPPRG